MGCGLSFAGRFVELLGSDTREAGGVAGTPACGNAETRVARGKEAHGEDCSAGPDPWLAPPTKVQ